MLKFEKLFRNGLIFLFIANVSSTLVAMIMIDKMIPTHDVEYILLDDQRLALQTALLNKVSPHADAGEPKLKDERALLFLDDVAQWSEEQKPHLALVKTFLEQTESTTVVADEDFYLSLKNLMSLQNLRIQRKLEAYRRTGLAGSWVVACLSLVGMLILWTFQTRMKKAVLMPVKEIVVGLNDWQQGNRQRRLVHPETRSEIQGSALIINEILDERPMR